MESAIKDGCTTVKPAEDEDKDVQGAAIIAVLQRVEHYNLAGKYRTQIGNIVGCG